MDKETNAITKIAMFIDADNAPAKKIDQIISDLAVYGTVNIRRAYGNWKNPAIKGWEETLHEFAIRPIQQFDLTKGKNATDMAMAIDVMDLLYTRNIDAFCIVSSDSDFTPLVMRILAEGKPVYGFGERKAPMPFVNACSKFLFLDEEKKEKKSQDNSKKVKGQDLKCDTKLINLIRKAVEAEEDDDGWAYLARIGTIISNQASLDPRNYGYKKLSDLIRAIDLFETKVKKLHSSHELYVRDKRRWQQQEKKVKA